MLSKTLTRKGVRLPQRTVTKRAKLTFNVFRGFPQVFVPDSVAAADVRREHLYEFPNTVSDFDFGR